MTRYSKRDPEGKGYVYSNELSEIFRQQSAGEPPLRGLGPFWFNKMLRNGRVDFRRRGLAGYRQFRDA